MFEVLVSVAVHGRMPRIMLNHMDYLHANPVKHGFVDVAIDWQWSSSHRWFRHGVYSADWTGSGVAGAMQYVE